MNKYQCSDLNEDDPDSDIIPALKNKKYHNVFFEIEGIKVDITSTEEPTLDAVYSRAVSAIKMLKELSNDADSDSGGSPPGKIEHIAGCEHEVEANEEPRKIHAMQRYIR